MRESEREREREREYKESWRQRGKRQNVYFLERQTDREGGRGETEGGGAWRHRLLLFLKACQQRDADSGDTEIEEG